MKIKNYIKESSFVNYITALFIVILIASVLIVVQGGNPAQAFIEMFKGAVGNKSAIATTIRWSIPIIITSQAAVIAHRTGINNLGLEGQLYMGALAAGIVGAFISLPHVPHVLVAFVIGGITGALFALIPALLKVFLHVDEMITTLMFNYVAVLLTEFITLQLMGFNSATDPALIATPQIKETASLTKIMPPYPATTGIFIAIAIVILIYFIYKKLRKGYEWKMTGDNITFAKYGGMKVIKNYLLVFLFSGFLAGIAGTTEILGPHQRFRSSFSTDLGWDGIMVSLVAKNKPIPTLFVALLWGGIKAGSLAMERTTSVNRILVTILQALFVLFVTIDVKQLYKDYMNNRKVSRKVAQDA